jgi:3-oxoacyl-[acyl-carrier protein] reductase
MDLGIKGRNAIICASSKGLGRACAMALAEAGVNVTINGRDAKGLTNTADEIAIATGVKVTSVVADVGTPEGRAALLAACPAPDILVNNNSGPPLKDFRQLSHDELIAGANANMFTPIELIQQVIDGMIERKFGRIINITSSSVKAPLAGLDLSSGARAGLTAFLAGIARQVAHANVTINHIMPGAFDTDRLVAATTAQARMRGVSEEEISNTRRQSIPAKRFGDPKEFGQLCAFLASAQAGYITGQSILIDGGAVVSAF